jgi:hypothetical protein
MRSTVMRVVAGGIALSAGILYRAGMASAHAPSYSLSCEGATIRGQGYENQHTNLAEIYIDDVVVLHIDDFGTDFEQRRLRFPRTASRTPYASSSTSWMKARRGNGTWA